jgi:hypothetical protein
MPTAVALRQEAGQKERGWGPHQWVKAIGGAQARWAVDGAVEGDGIAETAAGRQLLGGGEEAQDGATLTQGICGKERRRSIGAPQMEKGRRVVHGCSLEDRGLWKKVEGSCGAAHQRRGVSAPIYQGGVAGRRVERHREEVKHKVARVVRLLLSWDMLHVALFDGVEQLDG